MRSRRHAELTTDFFERASLSVDEAEAESHDFLLAIVEVGKRLLDGLDEHAPRRRIGRGLGLLVLDEVGESRVVLFAEW